MRIIAGHYKGTQLFTPVGLETRPTADRVRQTLFDILLHAEWGGQDLIQDRFVLDVFAGTGALGIEALSRGAKQGFFCEKNKATRQILEKNLQHCHCTLNSVVYKDYLTIPVAQNPCHLVFLDPPYRQNLIPHSLEVLENKHWLSIQSIIITEIAQDEKLVLNDCYHLLAERNFKNTCLKIWKKRK